MLRNAVTQREDHTAAANIRNPVTPIRSLNAVSTAAASQETNQLRTANIPKAIHAAVDHFVMCPPPSRCVVSFFHSESGVMS